MTSKVVDHPRLFDAFRRRGPQQEQTAGLDVENIPATLAISLRASCLFARMSSSLRPVLHLLSNISRIVGHGTVVLQPSRCSEAIVNMHAVCTRKAKALGLPRWASSSASMQVNPATIGRHKTVIRQGRVPPHVS